MKAPNSKTSARSQPDRELIATAAYHLYVENGQRDGHDVDDWLRVEELLIECSAKQQLEAAAAVTQAAITVAKPVRPPMRSRRSPRTARTPGPVAAARFERCLSPRQTLLAGPAARQEVEAA